MVSVISCFAERSGPSEDWPGLDSLRSRRRWCQVANCSTGVRTVGDSIASRLAASRSSMRARCSSRCGKQAVALAAGCAGDRCGGRILLR